MKKLNSFLIVIMLLMFSASNLKAQWINIPVTGFNADVVANGAATSSASTSASVDGVPNVFIDATFNPGSGICDTNNVWPTNLTINSLTTPGLTYILQPANVNNSMRLMSGITSGIFVFTTPVSVYSVNLLATGGNGACTFSATIKFTDSTTQAFTNLIAPEWCSGTSPATGQFYRTSRTTNTTCSTNLCQYMYEVNLAISTANQSKSIAYITISYPAGNNSPRLNIFAVGGVLPGPCSTPLNQPTSLILTPGTTSTVTGTFTASAGTPDHYLIVRSTADTLTQVPVNGQIYTAGSSFGGGKVVAYQSATNFSDAGLTAGITYYYYVFAANSNCIDTSRYVTANPLTGSTSIFNGTLTSSNLPIIILHTHNNASIVDTPKISAKMGVIYNGPGVRNYTTDPFNNYNDSIGIELRGSTSQGFPQKGYGVELWDSINIQKDTIVLNMPSDNDWILYAPYDDKSCMRNTLAYGLSNQLGHYAVHCRYCELILNNQYQGIYVWMEKIKRGANRLDIANLKTTDTSGVELTGGYIFKIDKTTGTGGNDGWNSNYKTAANSTIRFLYDDPSGTEIATQQATYIAAYVDSFETALTATNFDDPINGYRKYMDDKTFIDYFIINEISNNVDGLRLSTFLYKNKDSHGGKIGIGPVWDYNIAFGNANYNNGAQYTGWAYQMTESNTGAVPFWWARFMQDSLFKNSLRCRWFDLRQSTLSTASINHYIDSISSLLNEAQVRHFTKWPILGVYTWPNPTPYPSSYSGEVTALKTWLQNRLAWLDANMVGTNTYPLVNLGNDTAFCPGQTLTLDAANPDCVFLWNTGSNTQTITIATPGNYSVTVNKNYGCKTTDTISISLSIPPVISAGNDTSICKGNSIALTVTGDSPFAYAWNNGVQQGVPFVPDSTQYYSVSALGNNGCSTQDSVLVTIFPLPSKPTITVMLGALDTLISSSATTYQWYENGNILLGENGQKLLVSHLVTANYSVVITDANGCSSPPSDIFNITVGINENTANLGYSVYPNPATDKLSIELSQSTTLKNLNIAIYDIQGQLLLLQQIYKAKADLNISRLAKGIYVIKISNDNNTSISKFVKE